MWKKYSKITELPAGLWDSKVSRGDVCLDSRLLAVAEDNLKGVEFAYFIKYEGNDPVAVFMATLAADTPFYGVDGLQGKSFLTASTGTPETSGPHFWFDSGRMNTGRFIAEATRQISAIWGNARVVVFRDFSEGDCNTSIVDFEDTGFAPVETLTVSKATVSEGISSLDEYISSLKYKYRYQLAVYRGALDKGKYEVEVREDFPLILDQLYPLYLDVSERAGEYAADPYPVSYFHSVKERFGADSVAVTIKEKRSGRYMGFMLLLYTISSCVHQYIGFHRVDELYLWHNLTIESIGDAIGRGVHNINMGVTNSVSKRKFGAQSFRNFTFVRTMEKSACPILPEREGGRAKVNRRD